MPRPRRPFSERLFARVTIDLESGCWERHGHRVNGAYTQIATGGAGSPRVYAHRAAYELLVGPIPEGLTLDHLCRNTRCVNPAHLEPATSRENTMRGTSVSAVNAAKTHCVNGHSLDDAYIMRATGTRRCRVCSRERFYAWRDRNRDAYNARERAWNARRKEVT